LYPIIQKKGKAHTPENINGPPADFVRDEAEQGNGKYLYGGSNSYRCQDHRSRDLQYARGVGENERRVNVEKPVFRKANSHGKQHVFRMLGDRLENRHPRLFFRQLDFFKRRRLSDSRPYKNADRDKNDA
jgi:hypothetical protein